MDIFEQIDHMDTVLRAKEIAERLGLDPDKQRHEIVTQLTKDIIRAMKESGLIPEGVSEIGLALTKLIWSAFDTIATQDKDCCADCTFEQYRRYIANQYDREEKK